MDKTPRLERVAQVLELISASPDGLALAEVSSRTGMPMPSTHRLLNSLLEAGFVVGQRGRSRYRIGPRIVRIFQNSLSNEALQAIAEPILLAIANKFGEVAYMVRFVNGEIQPAVTTPPSQGTRTLVYPGNDFPLNASASAKAIVAFQDQEVIDRFLAGPHERYRPNTVVDQAKLASILKQVREAGYAINDDEYDPGVYSVCCPVQVEAGGVLYGVGVVAFKERLLMAHDVDDLVRDLKDASELLGKALRRLPDSFLQAE
ncbi:IclR family transcriptional regulator [Paraburkholderia terricola]|uniref:IclR family transcriptional regulator n=1 Tax=Paraburkholderia terricola TaxID=169427 RepID=UPI001591E1DB|nr:IclR family transcriptional regulator [Paraburkholderia terricola]